MFFGSEMSSTVGVKYYLKALHKPQKTGGTIVKFHKKSCNQILRECKATASGFTDDINTGK